MEEKVIQLLPVDMAAEFAGKNYQNLLKGRWPLACNVRGSIRLCWFSSLMFAKYSLEAVIANPHHYKWVETSGCEVSPPYPGTDNGIRLNMLYSVADGHHILAIGTGKLISPLSIRNGSVAYVSDAAMSLITRKDRPPSDFFWIDSKGFPCDPPSVADIRPALMSEHPHAANIAKRFRFTRISESDNTIVLVDSERNLFHRINNSPEWIKKLDTLNAGNLLAVEGIRWEDDEGIQWIPRLITKGK